ncbi:transient receptor potential cation channel protein painless [Zeugodacus cucurbitae]|uniref:transient receptor potential cation channel protein painless n=1 Tax=Zeugodacus cucurbitae TaxID=28588 RepID=UPI0005969509|nr:transient receptor potential cation channel protein painless [Zeugodacus cucurbitae]XP_011196697.1 transient receptor potential cation channel protein painless [Zeugodacus cucurbitae]XP_011196698.1 transient receptor potential cation channel protein painless [Zeugodacus cucurbitae]
MSSKPYSAINITNCGLDDPQSELGAAFVNNNLTDFRIALDKGANPARNDDKHFSVYELALKTHGCAAFVEECLRHGCSPNHLNQHWKKSAINFAADSLDPQILNVLLRNKDVQVDRPYAKLTPLNTLAKKLTTENQNDVFACIKLLLEYGASPNKPDDREMTPLNYILKNKKLDSQIKRELVELFTSQQDLDVDSFRDGEVREMLNRDYPEMLIKLSAVGVSLDRLVSLLRNGNEEEFVQKFPKYKARIFEKDNNTSDVQEQELQLFIESIKRGTHKAFDLLLNCNVNVNGVLDYKTPIQIATILGNWRALKILLEHNDLKLRQQDQLLITVIRHLGDDILYDFVNYEKCLYLLLNSDRIDVNESDPSGSTPLHYAVKYRNRLVIQELLRHGAYIGMRSSFNDLPIDSIHPEVLEEHFDSCITTNGYKPGDSDFEILINFKNLISQPLLSHATKLRTQNFHEEMPPIAYIAESKEHRHLLQHPLITSFLFLKWHRLSVIFYINFLLYFFFALSIITHTILKFRESEYEALTVLFGLFSWIGIIYLLIREIIQFVLAPLKYSRCIINYMEVALIILSIMTCSEPSYNRETQRVIAVFTILLVALELCLLVGSLPVLSISTHMLMLRAVLKSFIKSFALYSIFVITFSLCFYILFGKSPESNDTTNGTDTTSDGGEFNKFANPFTAVIKTIVMLTGEFDAGDIEFDTVYSYLIFLMFVVFMSIVLFNLLNGLAVSDTQAIKTQAELNGSICRTLLLTRYEHVLTGRTGHASFIIKQEPFRTICRRLMNLDSNYIVDRQIAILPNDHNRVFVGVAKCSGTVESKDNCGRKNEGRNSKSHFLPLSEENTNRQKKLLDAPVSFLPCCCTCITGKCSEMDSRTVKLAMAVIERKSTSQQGKIREANTERRLKNIEERLAQITELLQKLSPE